MPPKFQRELIVSSFMSGGFFSLALFFWIIGDIFWALGNLFKFDLFNPGIVYLPYFARIMFLAIGFIFIPKPPLNPFLTNRRRIEILMLVTTIAMYLWAFVMLPLLEINFMDFLSYIMIVHYQVLFFFLLYFTFFSSIFYHNKFFKGSFNLIIGSIALQLIGTLIFGIEIVKGTYPGGGIEDVIWISSSLSLALAGISFIKMPQYSIITERKLNFKTPVLSSLISILAASAFFAIIWSYYYNNATFNFILCSSGLLVILAIVRQFVADKYIDQSQEMLKNSEKKFRAIYEHANDAMIIIDKHGKISSWNSGAAKIFGYQKNEVIGKEAILIIPSPYQKKFQKLFGKILVKKEFISLDQSVNEGMGLKKGGEEFPLEYSLSYWYDDDKVFIALIVRDILERKEAEKKIKESLAEKEILLKEIHHRVKNNLQIVSSLLNIEGRYIENENDLKILREGQNRVHAMALIHKKLYETTDLSNVVFADYVETLVSEILDSYGINIKVDLELNIDDISIDIDQIIPYGLIINEIIKNSIKYAFPDGNGKISIKLSSDGSNNILVVSDNGIGLPEDMDIQKTRSLGLRLVKILTRQIKGNLEIEGTEGTTFRIISPVN